MYKYKISLKYNGCLFSGSQKQINKNTVFGQIENAISKVLKTPIVIVPAGRTDSGVHSELTVCHIEIGFKFNVSKIKHGLNKSLIKTGILILDIDLVKHDFHALSSATMRTYNYFFSFDVLPSYLVHSVAFIDTPPQFFPTNNPYESFYL